MRFNEIQKAKNYTKRDKSIFSGLLRISYKKYRCCFFSVGCLQVLYKDIEFQSFPENAPIPIFYLPILTRVGLTRRKNDKNSSQNATICFFTKCFA